MTNYREILRLDSLGINHTQIALSVGCTRQTVITVLSKAKQKGIRHSDVKNLSDKDLAKAIRDGGISRIQYQMPDYGYVHKELAKSGVTLNLLWVEYCEECRRSGTLPYQSTQFKKYYAEHIKKTGATMHIERHPGESLEVDWAGGKVGVTDPDTGNITGASVFVSALSYSGYAYVEAFWTMEEENWIEAHVNAYDFYGGVTRILIPDNLKTGVDAVTRSETVINKMYQDMAEHYGTAVIPARVKSPNDKPNAEGAVRIVKMWILAAIRNRMFFSLSELNKAIKGKLSEYNDRPFQRETFSRRDKYLEEREFLLPLPKHPFELATWKKATVAKDYHVKVLDKYFSVPFEYIGKRVDVRITKNVVEIFYEGLRICSHLKDSRQHGKYVTTEAHMPLTHQKYGSWNGDKFRHWAKNIGPNAVAVIESFLTGAKVEQQSYKTCNALLHLSEKHSPELLEAACSRVLSFMPRPSYKAVESVLRSGKGLTAQSTSTSSSADNAEQYGFIRGAEYYGGDNDAE
jgi:transposase